MADYAQINDVAAASIAQINDVPYANCAEVNDCTSPSLGATRWVVGADDGLIAHAANSDRTSWTTYGGVTGGGTHDNKFDIQFGQNASGQGVYVCTRDGGVREIQISGTDVTANAAWTDINIDGTSSNVKMLTVAWGARSDGTAAGTWFAVGQQTSSHQKIYRSTDGGTNWTAIDLSGLSGHSSSVWINNIASDGNGNWAFVQGNRFYYSTNDGQSFAVSTPFDVGANNKGVPGRAHALIFTNNSWVLMYSNSSQIHVRSCAASDITDWGDERRLNNLQHMSANTEKGNMAANASGRVVAVTMKNEADLYFFDVNGKTITANIPSPANGNGTELASGSNYVNLSMSSDNIKDVATDGNTWLLACQDGDIWESTNDGESWSQIANEQGADAADDFTSITCDVLLPL